jgi:hypothetical protein
MAGIASTNVTVTLSKLERLGSELKAVGTIAFGNGALTYPSGGVPLPALSNFRLRSANRMFLLGGEASGYVYKYDQTNHKIRIYQTAAVTPAGTVAAPVFTGESYTPAGTVAAPVFTGAAMSNFTPAGSVDAGTHVFTGTPASPGTPAGTNSAPAFTGAAHTLAGTNSAPAFTGAATTAAALAELGTGVAPAAVTLAYEAWGK